SPAINFPLHDAQIELELVLLCSKLLRVALRQHKRLVELCNQLLLLLCCQHTKIILADRLLQALLKTLQGLRVRSVLDALEQRLRTWHLVPVFSNMRGKQFVHRRQPLLPLLEQSYLAPLLMVIAPTGMKIMAGKQLPEGGKAVHATRLERRHRVHGSRPRRHLDQLKKPVTASHLDFQFAQVTKVRGVVFDGLAIQVSRHRIIAQLLVQVRQGNRCFLCLLELHAALAQFLQGWQRLAGLLQCQPGPCMQQQRRLAVRPLQTCRTEYLVCARWRASSQVVHPQRQHRLVLERVGFLVARRKIYQLPQQRLAGTALAGIDATYRQVITQVATEYRAITKIIERALCFIVTPELHQYACAQRVIGLAQIGRHLVNACIKDRQRLGITLLLIIKLAEMNPDARRQLVIDRLAEQLVEQFFCFTRHTIAGVQGAQQDLRAFGLGWQGAGFKCKEDVAQRGKLLTLIVIVEYLPIGRINHRMRTIKTPVTLRRDSRQAQQACQKRKADTHGMHYFQLLKLNTGCCAAASSSIFSWI